MCPALSLYACIPALDPIFIPWMPWDSKNVLNLGSSCILEMRASSKRRPFTVLSQAGSQLPFPDPDTAESLCREHVPCLQELSNTLWAYARLQHDPYKTRPLLKAVARQVRERERV